MRTRTPRTEFPECPLIIQYLQHQLAKRIIQEHGWDKPYMTVGIGLGWPRHHVEISLHSLTMDRQAAVILYDLGIPDALETSGSYRNFNEDYLSISGKSLDEFGRANREKILEWDAQYVPPKPLMERVYEVIKNSGEKYDALMGDYASKLFLHKNPIAASQADDPSTVSDDEPSESFGGPLEAPEGQSGGAV
jgi:hypothetical protein